MSEIQNQIGGDHYRKMAIARLNGHAYGVPFNLALCLMHNLRKNWMNAAGVMNEQ